MPSGFGSWLLRLLVGWLVMVAVVSHVQAAEGEGPREVEVMDAVDRGGESDPVEDRRDEVRERGWIDNNLVLFLVLVHGSWISVAIAWMLIARHYNRVREEKRTNALGEIAGELELKFLAEGDEALTERLASLPLFNIGRNQTLSNLVVADTAEVQVALFDFKYVTGRGKSKRVRRQTVVAVQATELRMPAFHLRPERTLVDALGSLVGMQDIDFDDHPGFSKAFVLKSPEEQEARDFFDHGLLDCFVSRPDVSFEALSGLFVYFRRWKEVDAQAPKVKAFLGEGFSVLQALRERLARN
ncbi:MAG: hypothetical protein VX311_05490 [Planctomycetota bacterium]|nr:hypothetical protein [Planctomycetota bacterium]